MNCSPWKREDAIVTRYRDYVIEARPLELRDGGWTTDVDVSRDHGSHISLVHLSARNTWPSRTVAIEHSVDLAVRAIDGQIASCNLDGL